MSFNRPEEDDYHDWIESLPECPLCEGGGEICGDYDGEERTCPRCDGAGVLYPELEDD